MDRGHSKSEKGMLPFAFLAGSPTNPHAVPFLTTAPEGLALVCSAATPPEADLVREMLRGAGFQVEFVPSVMTGAFGMTGSQHVFVRADEAQEAREFLAELQSQVAAESLPENDGT